MRIVVLALTAALSLAACGRSSPTGGAQTEVPGDGAFPDLAQESYRAEGTLTTPEGHTVPSVMIRSAGKLRWEVSAPEGSLILIRSGRSIRAPAIFITNAADAESIIIPSWNDGRPVALRVNDGDQSPAAEWGVELAVHAIRTGSCSVADENGSEWRRSDEEGEQTACVTTDGIILRAGGAGWTPSWEATRVERGPQDAALFEVPSGVEVVDMR
ncbi:MAG: hypothetical protein ABL883_07420 [Terricaulis sp.]